MEIISEPIDPAELMKQGYKQIQLVDGTIEYKKFIGWTNTCNCGRRHEIYSIIHEDGRETEYIDTGWY